MWKKQIIRLCVLAGMLTLAGGNAVATAATSPFGCRASVARASLGGTTLLEPIIANRATSPCHTAGDGVNTASVANQGSELVDAGPAGVFTYSSADASSEIGGTAPAAAALATVNGVVIPNGSNTITAVGPATAQVSYICRNGTLSATGSSNLDVLKIGNQDVTLTPGQTTLLDLGGGSYIKANEQIKTGNSLTERVLDVHLQGLADVVVGEAEVTEGTATPCAGTNSEPTAPTGACPAGSTYDMVSSYCVIVEGGTTIIISRPFQGPTGGTVVSLTDARKKYSSACLSGKGPNYVIVGTSHNDRIVGTRLAERILGRGGNDRIAGQGGNDCIDGGSGNDRIYAGNGTVKAYGGSGDDRIYTHNGNDYVDGGEGNDRIYLGDGNDSAYGDNGNDVIAGGRGDDKIYGGTGNDRLSSLDGNDYVNGGSGNNRVYVGNGTDRVTTGSGSDRIYAPGENDTVSCGGGKDLAYVNPFVVAYAKHHGCARVRQVRPHRS